MDSAPHGFIAQHFQRGSIPVFHSPFPCISPSYVVKTIFRNSSVLAFTQTGFNAMFGHNRQFGQQFAKPYHHQYGICAEVIGHLHLHGNPSEINDLV